MKKYIFTSESVSEGHPDKICDLVSDNIVDAFLAKDPESRVAAETMVTNNKVVVSGEVNGPDIFKSKSNSFDELTLFIKFDHSYCGGIFLNGTINFFSIDKLSEICDQNETNAAKDSLNSELINWQDGKKVICRDWIQNLLSELSPTAENFGMKHLLDPIYKVLEEGNQSIKWINQYEKGLSIEQIMKISIEDMIRSEA